MQIARVDLDSAVGRVMDGSITNAMAVVGLLAVATARLDGFTRLRPVDAPWEDRPRPVG